jgi:hypothetical protein
MSVFVDVAAPERERVARFAVPANEQNLDRLTAHVLGPG